MLCRVNLNIDFEGWSGDKLLIKGWKYEARAGAGICEWRIIRKDDLKYEGSEDEEGWKEGREVEGRRDFH
jgi:hypothetical protein